jgi:hypothetical protein
MRQRFFLLAIFALSAGPQISGAQGVAPCTVESLTNNCEIYLDPNRPSFFSDGSTFYPSIWRSMDVNTNRRLKRADYLFENAKYLVQKKLRDLASGRALTKGEEDLIQKISRVTLKKLKEYDDVCMTSGTSYDAKENHVNLCEPDYMYPDASVIYVIAHEMFHAIGPCHSQWGLYRPNVRVLQSQKDDALRKLANLKLKLSLNEGDRRTLLRDYCETTTDLEEIDRLVSRGDKIIYSPRTPDFPKISGAYALIRAGVPKDNYPFKDFVTCLSGSLGLRRFNSSPQAIEDAVRANLQPPKTPNRSEKRALEKYLNKIDDPDLRDCTRQLVEEHPRSFQASLPRRTDELKRILQVEDPTCTGDLTGDQRTEAFADLMATEVTGEFLGSSGNRYENEPNGRMAPASQFLELACGEMIMAEFQKGVLGTLNKLWSYASGLISEKTVLPPDSHLESKKRVEEIILKDPRIRRASGCTDAAVSKPCSLEKTPSATAPSEKKSQEAVK